ncbi:MAG: hypothetical protein DMG89_14935 [Acidobacteria bacterium]|nr:MAG: hypothetical protein DMG89_14935 [Acidobacteriota bacterium]
MAVKAPEIHPSALSDLKSAISWYLERSEPAAIEFAAEVDRAVALVVESPARWPSGEHGTRKFVLNRFPFAVIHREKLTSVQIYWRLLTATGTRNIGKAGCSDHTMAVDSPIDIRQMPGASGPGAPEPALSEAEGSRRFCETWDLHQTYPNSAQTPPSTPVSR